MSKYERGHPGGPGRPVGSRSPATELFDRLGLESADELMKAVLAKARGGDLRAAEIVLARVWPQRKGRPVKLDLPPIREIRDLLPAQSMVLAAIGAGAITPEEGEAVASVIEAHRRTHEMVELDQRLETVEFELGLRRK